MSDVLFIVKSKREHFWQSCRIIEEHALSALKASTLDVEILETDDILSTEQIEKLKSAAPTAHLYFLSDVLLYQKICAQLSSLDHIRYYFPIYGNMTMEIYRWQELGLLLKGKPALLLGASPRSCQQIKLFTESDAIFNVPYPFSPPALKRQLSTDTIDLVYAGRMTAQKNVLPLMSAFIEALNHRPELRLHLAGSFHDRGYHLHGYKVDFDNFKKQFESLIQQSKGRILYHGDLAQEELFALYSRCDYFTSMSTYHDEDFGMSAAQAYSLGLGLILSDWGGHAAYQGYAQMVTVSVDGENIPHPQKSQLIKQLIVLAKTPQPSQLKLDFGYAAFTKRLRGLMGEKVQAYNGQSPLYLRYAERALKMYPFHPDEVGSELYEKIYSSYLKN